MNPVNEEKSGGRTSAPVDWTGVAPDTSPIAELNAETFVARLQRLSEHARSLTLLRQSMADQQTSGEQLSRNPEPATRSSR